MFTRLLDAGAIVQPFAAAAPAGGYWLTWLKSRSATPAMAAFQDWITAEAAAGSS
jgi:LysR family transcriptional regulator of beta-lactamase